MLRLIYLITAMAVSAVTTMVYGQTEAAAITITGTIISEKNEASNNTIIYLMDSSNKTIIKTETPAENGNFLFENVTAGTYLIKISENGKQLYLGEPFSANQSTELKTITLSAATSAINEVVITKTKPYIERQDGKMILNVESAIGSTGTSAFEVLEKAPGVNVDSNDNISLRGKTGILIQIDGKPTPMSGSNLANYLRGIPSGAIDKIEFITNPSAKYDAAGSAIINIKMKKEKKAGVNGSVSSSYGQGKYPKTNNNMSLNHGGKKLNLFGSYSFAYREGFNNLILDRNFYEGENFNGKYEQDNYLKMNFRNHIGRIGADYTLNDKHSFGIIVNKVSNRFDPTGKNYSSVFDETNAQVSRFETDNRSKDNWHNQSLNLNHKFVIDTLGTEWTTDFDYANYGNDTKQNFTTRYFNPDNTFSQIPYLLHGDLAGDLNIFSLKTDYVTTLKNKLKVESGLKSSYVKADNNLAFYDISTGNPEFDATKSNHFIYKENINAAYANFSKGLGKWNFTLGLRVENTNITGHQLVGNTSVSDSYTQLFPSAFASYSFNEKNSLELNYSRRIQRPSYDQLNPFKFYLDPTTYKEGNPYLEPQTTHSLELTHVLNQKIYTTLSFSRTNDNITETISPSPTEEKVTIQSNKNLAYVDIYSLAFIIPVPVTKWWDTTNNLNFYVGSYNGTVANTTLSNAGNFTWNVNSANKFKLGNGFFAELTAEYRAKERYAFDLIEPIWFVNTGLQKKFKNTSSLKLAMNDVFNTNNIQATVKYTGYKETFDVSRDTRVITLSYTYNFGKATNMARKRTGGADDIKQRAGSNG